jgi:hypothetical protein
VRDLLDHPVCCDRLADAAGTAHPARRQLLKAAVFGPPGDQSLAVRDPGEEDADDRPPRAVTGTILDVSPHILVLAVGGSEERFALSASSMAWRGGPVVPAALRRGDWTVVRRHPSHWTVADRIWAGIGRVTGTIIEKDGGTLLVDEGETRGRRILIIPDHTLGKIQVRFPRLEPGFLVDVIGLRRDGFLEGMIPATSQPAYRADHMPGSPLVNGHIPATITGAATWHEPGEEPDGLSGVAYPALDPETGCEEQATPGAAYAGCVRLPYLSVGSLLRVRNQCAKRSQVLPVIGCGAVARLFCDRCVECHTSPRGRVADLTVSSFVELGGDLEAGCFNATITIGG